MVVPTTLQCVGVAAVAMALVNHPELSHKTKKHRKNKTKSTITGLPVPDPLLAVGGGRLPLRPLHRGRGGRPHGSVGGRPRLHLHGQPGHVRRVLSGLLGAHRLPLL